jgi:ATP-binding cassette, subfamily G (WHITE), eye pigment precursor transporter
VSLSWATTYCVLLGRDIKNILRNPMLIKSRIFQTILQSIYVGGLYCNIGHKYEDTITWHALTGFFYFLALNAVFIPLLPAALTFPQERNVFLKEESAKLYGSTAYFMSKSTVDIPYVLFFPVLQSLIFYWFVGLSSTPAQFFTFYLIVVLGNFCGVSMGLFVGSISRDSVSAGMNVLAFVIPFIMFSGYFKNESNLAGWNGWIQYISPFKYTFSALTQNEVLYKASSIGLLNFDVGLWPSVGCLVALGVGARIMSLFFLWKLRRKLE